jgi:lipid-A-disaccharide synthase
MARYFLIAGETSGDHLGAQLIKALRGADAAAQFCGVGGAEMTREGLTSLFPISDIAVMGLLAPLARLPTLLARIAQTARAAIGAQPDCVVLIDAPDFTHRVARRIRASAPQLPILDYVCPSVWAWRPGRAKTMRAYVDHALAILPFEPEAMRALGGPPCDYVGHPLIEWLPEFTPDAEEIAARETPSLLVLPGSRVTEIQRMTPLYGETLRLLLADFPDLQVTIPVAPGMAPPLRKALRDWPLRVESPLPDPPSARGNGTGCATLRLIAPEQKLSAFRSARAALATSGVVTLELALAQVPMAVAYRVAAIEAPLRHLVRAHSIVLPNLILGENAIPEFLQEAGTPQALAATLAPLLSGGAARKAQSAALARVRAATLAAGENPSARAAAIIAQFARRRRASENPARV